MRKYKIRKSLCMLLVLTLLAVSLAGCGRSEAKYTADGKKQIITIGYLPITHALAVFEEKELLDADENSTLQIQLQKFQSVRPEKVFPVIAEGFKFHRIHCLRVINLFHFLQIKDLR